jgi:hypothetical protein
MTRRPGPRFSVRWLMMAVAFVALMIAWSSRWSDCKYRAAVHATLAAERRFFVAQRGRTDRARDRQRREAEWHEEMSRRFERAKWIPWPFGPTEPPRPEGRALLQR